jgi:hypothetical protein
MESGSITKAIQVTQRIHGSNEGRELGGLMEAMDRYKLQEGLILTEDTEDVFDKDGRKIIVMPVWKWLLE